MDSLSSKKKKDSKWSLSTLMKNAKEKKASNTLKFDALIEKHSIPTNAPTYPACKKSFVSGGIARALSKAPETVKKQVWKVVSKKRNDAFNKAKEESLKKSKQKVTKRYLKEFDKLPAQEWLMIPEWLIVRNPHAWNLENLKKGGTIQLPPIIVGAKKGFWDMLVSYTDGEPGTEEFGSIIKSKYGINDRNNSSNNYCDYIPCYDALVAMVRFYRVGAKFCKGDPYAALFRANMREIHPVWNILADGLYFENDFSIVRGHRNIYSGIEVNGVWYRLPAEQIVDTFTRFNTPFSALNLYCMLLRLQAICEVSVNGSMAIWAEIRDEFKPKGMVGYADYTERLKSDPLKDESFNKLTSQFGLLFDKMNKKMRPETDLDRNSEYGSTGFSMTDTEPNPTFSEEEDEGGGESNDEDYISKMMSGMDSDTEIIPSDVESEEEDVDQIVIEDDFFKDLNTGVASMFSKVHDVIHKLDAEGNNIAIDSVINDMQHVTTCNVSRQWPYSLVSGQAEGINLEDERTFSRQIHFSEDRIVFIKDRYLDDR
jgi:hypothetical protein